MTITIPIWLIGIIIAILVIGFFAILPPLLMGLSEWNYDRKHNRHKRER
jgi:hypothetical protein